MGHGCGDRYDDTHAGFVRHAQKVGTVVLVCLAIWAVTGFGYFWPAWVALFGGAKLAAHARSVYRDDSDAEPEPADADFTVV